MDKAGFVARLKDLPSGCKNPRHVPTRFTYRVLENPTNNFVVVLILDDTTFFASFIFEVTAPNTVTIHDSHVVLSEAFWESGLDAGWPQTEFPSGTQQTCESILDLFDL